MHSKKTILFVMNTLGRAGAERALIELMRVLDPEKYRIFLYVLIPRGELFAEVPEYVTVLNRKKDARSVLSTDGKIFVAGRLLKAALHGGSGIRALRRLAVRDGRPEQNGAADRNGTEKSGAAPDSGVRTEKILRRMLADGTPALPRSFDLAVAYLEGPATWYVAEKIRAEKKAAFLHVDYRRAGYTRDLDNGCYDAFDRIYAVSEEVRGNFLEMYPEHARKTRLFYNIINREHIRIRAEEPGGFSDGYKGIRLLTVGRLYHQKGYDTAIRTAAILKKQGYEFRWYALGEGEEEKHLKKLVRDYGLEETFFFAGAADNPYPYFRQADIYVCTSRYEGKSIVIEEAQALGKPVVAADCTGIAEQIESGKDGVIAGNSPEALAGAVGELIRHPELREAYGRAAADRKAGYLEGLADFLSLAGGADLP